MNKDGQFAKFYDIFLKEIYPEYGEIEKQRISILKEYRKKIIPFRFLLFIFVIIGITGILTAFIATFLTSFFFSRNHVDFTINFALVPGMLLAIPFLLIPFFIIPKTYHTMYNKEYRRYLKEKFFLKVMKAFDKIEIEDDCKTMFDDCDFLSKEYYEYICDDFFKGIYKGIEFKVAELSSISHSSRSNYDSQQYRESCRCNMETVMLFDYNKKVASDVCVTSNKIIKKENAARIFIIGIFLILVLNIVCIAIPAISAWNEAFFGNTLFGYIILFVFFFVSIFPLLATCLLLIPGFKKGSVFEDPKFNKLFCVNSKDEVEARYHCTTAFMERLLNLKTAFDVRDLECLFYNSNGKPKLMIKIHTGSDVFEFGDINKPINEDPTIFKFYREINSIYQIIDALKLDNKTGV